MRRLEETIRPGAVYPAAKRCWRGIRAGVAVSILLIAAGCASVPLETPREPSVAIADTSELAGTAGIREWLGGRDDTSGFYPLAEGFDAFGARLRLIDTAEATIDAQYFLMKPDDAGFTFLAKLIEAAERGVRIRLLLDDIFTTMDDDYLDVLDDYPNAEVRIFNPISRRGLYMLNYVGHFGRLNRRMHNKSFTVDNLVSVVGGRNIAVEYFQLETTGEFVDFDMLAVGTIVPEVSAQFDTYWNHKLAVPLVVVAENRDDERVAKARRQLERSMAEAGDSIYGETTTTPLMEALISGEVEPFVAEGSLIADDPQKLLEKVSRDQQLVVQELGEVLANAEKEIYIFTPYFIPRKEGVEFLRNLTDKGVRVVVLTNSLATNNHTAVHSSYSSYRKRLLKAGVELWEARADAAKITNPDGTTELDKLTLHTKGMVIDDRIVFVGSLNLDPRSIDINTEMGLLIESENLATLISAAAADRLAEIGYRLELDENDKISWHATIDGQEVVETKEPQTTAWQRFSAWFQKIVPESQL